MIDDPLIQDLLDLARLTVTAAEREQLLADLQGILEFVAQLDEAAVGEDSGLLNPPPGPSRDDRIQPWPDPKILLQNAPDAVDGYFRVPPRGGAET